MSSPIATGNGCPKRCTSCPSARPSRTRRAGRRSNRAQSPGGSSVDDLVDAGVHERDAQEDAERQQREPRLDRFRPILLHGFPTVVMGGPVAGTSLVVPDGSFTLRAKSVAAGHRHLDRAVRGGMPVGGARARQEHRGAPHRRPAAVRQSFPSRGLFTSALRIERALWQGRGRDAPSQGSAAPVGPCGFHRVHGHARAIPIGRRAGPTRPGARVRGRTR